MHQFTILKLPWGPRGASLVAALGICGAVTAQDVIVDRKTGHAYELVSSEQSWEDAKRTAESKTHEGRRGHLVTITSREEIEFVKTTFATRPGGIRLGALRSDAESSAWTWVAGEPWTKYSSWAPGEPNNHQASDDSQGTDWPRHQIYENQLAVVLVMRPDNHASEAVEQYAGKALSLLGKKLATTALSKVLPATASKIAGFGLSIITSIPSVGNPTRVSVQLVSAGRVSDSVAVGSELVPIVQWNSSDTLDFGVSIALERSEGTDRWERVTVVELLTVAEMQKVSELAPAGSFMLAVPRKPMLMETAGEYRVSVVARSTDGRASARLQVNSGGGKATSPGRGVLEIPAEVLTVKSGQLTVGKPLYVYCTDDDSPFKASEQLVADDPVPQVVVAFSGSFAFLGTTRKGRSKQDFAAEGDAFVLVNAAAAKLLDGEDVYWELKGRSPAPGDYGYREREIGDDNFHSSSKIRFTKTQYPGVLCMKLPFAGKPSTPTFMDSDVFIRAGLVRLSFSLGHDGNSRFYRK